MLNDYTVISVKLETPTSLSAAVASHDPAYIKKAVQLDAQEKVSTLHR
jgi:hypothetical protein